MSENGALRALHLGLPQAFLGGCVGALFTVALQGRGHLPGGILVFLLGTAVLASAAWAANYAVLKAGEGAITTVHMPSGDTTAYVPTFSHIEALEVRGDLDGAARAWDEACTAHPDNALVRVKAADFHLRLRKDAAAALPRYRAARDLPGASRELVRYAQAKLVDLYLGPLQDEGRAMVELRRLIESFPGTREAEEARAALARLKAQRHAGG